MYVEPYMTSQVVDKFISAWYETNQNGAVHYEGSKGDEVVEVWTGKSNNPICTGVGNNGRVYFNYDFTVYYTFSFGR